MAALKANRSVGLYLALTMVAAFLPAFLVGFVAARCYSEISSLSVFALLGLAGGGLKEVAADILGDVAVFAILVWAACIAYAVYVVVLFWGVCKDMNAICGKYSLGSSLNYVLVMLLSAVTLNIYYIYWSYQQGSRLKEAEARYQERVSGNGSSHMALALLGSAPAWIIGFFVFKLRTDPLYFVRKPLVILGVALFGIVLGFMEVANRVIFLKDVNALAGAYNMQQGGAYASSQMEPRQENSGFGQDVPRREGDGISQNVPQQEGSGFRKDMQQPAPPSQDGYTMPVDGWMPDAESAWKPEQGSMGYLEGRRGEYTGAVIPVEGELMVGRDAKGCQVVVKRPDVSRVHCKISYNSGDKVYTVTDCSSNGVFNQDGARFPQNVPVACSPGTVLVIAKSGTEFLLK